ncbi:DUF1622 domain-containing protein [Glycomyces albidus]|uniref:DUF1622 domain-containing protein n=1 Tax=Glycomyces albidus TaxID=2656774 RepID=A0A6L5G977_9ACTN|nr:DUF1622 domain-containing protein [Glycomyces albidus]MQM26161.1 DUF1622 domain-containing protein [Glycomyces albidus]
MDFEKAVHAVGTAVDLAGVAAIIVGALVATVLFAVRIRSLGDFAAAYRHYRRGLGRSILLGLEFLVAGDIIRTVAISPTFESVGVLAAIVLVRTFLSFALEKELEHTEGGAPANAESPDRPG